MPGLPARNRSEVNIFILKDAADSIPLDHNACFLLAVNLERLGFNDRALVYFEKASRGGDEHYESVYKSKINPQGVTTP